MTAKAANLFKQVMDSGVRSVSGLDPHVEDDMSSIIKILKSNASSAWNAGNPIGDTDAVVLELTISTGYWSVCHKDDFAKAKEILESTLTNAGG